MTRSDKTMTITGWQLCNLVLRKLRQEPQNYCQALWTISPEERSFWGLPGQRRGCGTAHCIGGWMATFIPDFSPSLTTYIYFFAQKFGLSWDSLHVLFAASAVEGTPGTKEYADRGIKHLRRFMVQHEEKLKAVRIEVFAEMAGE